MFSSKIIIPVGSDGELILRKPDARELKAFHKEAYGRKDSNDIEARCNLFDTLFVKVVNCYDDDGDIPEDGKGRIPAVNKNTIVLKYVESMDIHDPKNF